MDIDINKLQNLIEEYKAVNSKRIRLGKEVKNVSEQQIGIEKQISSVLGFSGYRLPLEEFR